MSAYDRSLAGYRTGFETVWCSNPACENHDDGVEVRWVTEYGQSTWDPSECFLCHQPWLQEKPEAGQSTIVDSAPEMGDL